MKGNFAVTIIILFTLTSSLIVYTENSQYTLSGYVKNAEGKTLGKAKIILFKRERESWKLTNMIYADLNGKYEVKVEEGVYRIIAIYDLNLTPGFDYTIHIKEVEIKDNIQVNFTLMKAATIMVKGDPITAATDEPAKYIEYEVEVINGTEIPGLMKNFGILFEYTKSMGITDKTIIIPANRYVNVITKATFLIGREVTTLEFNLTDKPIRLSQGEYLEIPIERASLSHSLRMVEDTIKETISLIEDAERKGFYMSIFKSKLSRINGLVLMSKAKLKEGKYEACYVDLREAYMSILYLKEKVLSTFSEAASSTSMIIFLLALTSSIFGEIMFEKRIKKIVATIICYALALISFHNLFPGTKLINLNDIITWASTSIIITEMLIIWPQVRGEKPGGPSNRSIIVSIFSLAKRNLKRRKIRALLTLISILILIGGFVSLTSVSIEEGLMERSFENQGKFMGILIDKIKPPSIKQPFIPLDLVIIEKIRQREDVEWVSIKYESLPSLSPLDYLIKVEEAEIRHPIYGVISFSNKFDPMYIAIEKRLIDGRMPEKNGEIVIPEKTASILNIKPNERVLLTRNGIMAKVVGIVSDEVFSIIDYDGRSLTPSKMVMIDGEEPIIEVNFCEVEEIIIMWWEDASELYTLPSRLIASINSDERAIVIAKNIALKGGYRALAFTSDRIVEYKYGTYLETRGMEATLSLILSVFNVSIVMLSSVYERKREIMTLSALGLNPSHVSMLFAAEALIVGLIAGGLGYIVGLSFYQISKLFGLFIEVYPKVSFMWTSATIGLAMVVALAGAIPALKSSIIVTPSKLMRWKADKTPSKSGEPWNFIIPIRIREDEVLDMLQYTFHRLKRHSGVEQIKLDKKKWILRFRYTIGRGSMGASSSVNQLQIVKRDSEIKIILITKAYGESLGKHAYETARLVRSIILHWRSETVS